MTAICKHDLERDIDDLFNSYDYVKIEKNQAGRITITATKPSYKEQTSCSQMGLGLIGRLIECCERMFVREYDRQVF